MKLGIRGLRRHLSMGLPFLGFVYSPIAGKSISFTSFSGLSIGGGSQIQREIAYSCIHAIAQQSAQT